MALRDDLASDAHDAWMEENARNGITSRLSSLTGEEQMVPFADLSPAVQQYDYALVDVIIASLKRRGYALMRARSAEA
jgi:hypothetical protein